MFILETDLSSLRLSYNVVYVFSLTLSVFWIPIDNVDLDCYVCFGSCSVIADFYFLITLLSAEIFFVASSIVSVMMSILYPMGDFDTFLI